jgi:hypothetical protein
MLNTPFSFEMSFTPAEYEKLGQLALRWSHIEHVLANCLRSMLRISNEEAIIVVFEMGAEKRLAHINELASIQQLNKDAKAALSGLNWVISGIRSIRNNVAHAVIMYDDKGRELFELRSKQRQFTKEQVFASEELTNYAAHAAISLRLALGVLGAEDSRHALPERPDVPKCLTGYFQATSPGRKARRQAQPRSSRR